MKASDFLKLLVDKYNYNFFAVRRLIQDKFSLTYEINTDKELDDNIVNNILNTLETKKDYPLEYFTNKVTFYNRDFYVDENVLIPRNETEELIELILTKYSNNNFSSLLDIGTGSGIIGITLGNELNIKITLVDIIDKALEIALRNSKANNINPIVIKSNFLEEVVKRDLKFDLVVSNPPYIGIEDEVGNETSYEPSLALYSNNHGLDSYYQILKDLDKVLLKDGIAFFETNSLHHEEYSKLIDEFPIFNFEFLKDSSDKWRFMVVKFR